MRRAATGAGLEACRQGHVERETVRRDRRLAVSGVMVAAMLASTLGAALRPRLVWNASPSVPMGLYRIAAPVDIEVGDIVIARLAAPWRDLAATRHYLPSTVPLVKRVAAVAGDEVCARGRRIRINGRPAAIRLRSDPHGRPMTWWFGCERLRNGRVLLLTADPASFDGRYFGPTAAADIIGRARLLWRR